MYFRLFSVSVFSFVISVILQKYFNLNAVIVTAGIALLGTFLFRNSDIRNIIYVSVFCSMGGAFKDDYYFMHSLVISILIVLIYSLLRLKALGHGGKLGSIAFITTTIYFLTLGVL